MQNQDRPPGISGDMGQVSTLLKHCMFTSQSKDACLSNPSVEDAHMCKLLCGFIPCIYGVSLTSYCLILRGAEVERNDRNCYNCKLFQNHTDLKVCAMWMSICLSVFLS